MTLSTMTLCHYAECCCAGCRDLFIVMMYVVMPSVIMVSVVAPQILDLGENSLQWQILPNSSLQP